jgi:glycosyltransferase involved in cell wall biosynthesis
VFNINILLATYNGENFLNNQLDSLLVQSEPSFKVLIRDDGSSDSTLDIIKGYERKYPEIFQVLDDGLGNLGSSACFMKLLEHADEYSYIMFCDQDDVWLEDKVSSALGEIQKLESVHGADVPLLHFTDLKVVDESLDEINSSFWDSQGIDPDIAQNWQCLLAQNVVTGCTMILNQKAREVSLPFSLPEMVHDQWIAVHVAKYGKISYSHNPTLLYRQHQSNVVGAHKNLSTYLLKKAVSPLAVLKFFYRASQYFGDVSVGRLIWYKFTTNIRRIF